MFKILCDDYWKLKIIIHYCHVLVRKYDSIQYNTSENCWPSQGPKKVTCI